MRSCDGLDLGSSVALSMPWVPFHHLRSAPFRCEEGKLPENINPCQSLTALGNISWNNNNDGCCCSISKLCLSLCDPLDCSTQGSSVFHCLLTIWAWVCSNSCTLSLWCYLTIPSSVPLFPACLQSFPASEFFLKSQFFAWGSQSIRESFSFSISPSSEYSGLISFRTDLTGLIALLSKGLSRVFSSTTIQKHQFFGTRPSLWPSSHIRTWLLEKPQLWLYGQRRI